MTVTIRPFTADDYEALARIGDAAYSDAEGQPLMPHSADDMRADDADRQPHIKAGRWVAEVDGQIVGATEYDQEAGRYHPRRFWVDLYVHPEYQRRGIGTALYERLLAELELHQPELLRNTVREDQTNGLRFAVRQGWREAKRQWESFLDLTKFDPTPFAGAEDRVLAQGIAILTLPELATDPDRDRKLYDLLWEIRQDFPDIDAATRETFEEFKNKQLGDPKLLPDGYFVAVQAGAYLGLATHTTFGARSDTIRIGQTGVARAARRRGIALALKLRAIAWAKERGARYLRTVNESSNTGILSINERMGFEKRPAWIDLVKTFDP
jgi:mycothiol synthase